VPAVLAVEALDLDLDGGEVSGGGGLGLDVEGKGEQTVEVPGPEGDVGDVDGPEVDGGQPALQGAQHGGLAAAGLALDQDVLSAGDEAGGQGRASGLSSVWL